MDDDVLGDVDQAAGQVAGVCGTQGGVGQTLAGAVSGDEVLQNGQALAEVSLDGVVDGLAAGVGHQTAHAGQLADLLDVTSCTGEGHHVDGVELVEVLCHGVADGLVGLVPHGDDLALALLCRGEAHLVLFLDLCYTRVCLGQDLLLLGRDGGVVDRDGDTSAGGVVEAGGLEAVQNAAEIAPG